MPNPPFSEVPLEPRGIVAKLFGREPPENARIELNNALAGAASYREIEVGFIDHLRSKYGFDVRTRFSTDLLNLYKTAARFYLDRSKVVEADAQSLSVLEALLGIPADQAKQARMEVCDQAFFPLVLSAAVLGTGQPSFEPSLNELAARFGVSYTEAFELFHDGARKMLEADERALADKALLSPDEMRPLEDKALRLGFKWPFDTENSKAIERAKRSWRLLYGELPTVAVQIALTRNEKCIWSASASRYELRKERVATNYSGLTGSIKIMRGLHYRMGTIKSTPITRDVIKEVDRGELYLTTSRVIFAGQSSTTSVKWERILEVTPHSDGVEIRRDTGKNLVFIHNGDYQDCGALMYRMLNSHGDHAQQRSLPSLTAGESGP